MKRLIPFLLYLCLAWLHPLQAQTAELRLVLVTSAQSAIPQLSAEEARKLYLGMPMVVDGKLLHPLRNNTDTTVQEMFMQKVMFMSTQAYERQILSRVFRQGGSRPPVYTEAGELLRALENDKTSVTYMPRDMAIASPKLRIIGEP
jgi:hypothetical protein